MTTPIRAKHFRKILTLSLSYINRLGIVKFLLLEEGNYAVPSANVMFNGKYQEYFLYIQKQIHIHYQYLVNEAPNI